MFSKNHYFNYKNKFENKENVKVYFTVLTIRRRGKRILNISKGRLGLNYTFQKEIRPNSLTRGEKRQHKGRRN